MLRLGNDKPATEAQSALGALFGSRLAYRVIAVGPVVGR